jgi:hypothetical protein
MTGLWSGVSNILRRKDSKDLLAPGHFVIKPDPDHTHTRQI